MEKIINWHTILKIIWNDYHIICWTCWRYCKKSMQWVYQSKRCKKCQDVVMLHYAWRGIKQWCYILWLNEFSIRNRIKRWWTIKEALFQHKRVFKEEFNEKDLKYMSDFYSKSFSDDKKLEEKCNKKYDKLKVKY